MPTLNWIGQEAVVKHYKEVPFRLLEPVPQLSCGPAQGKGSSKLILQNDKLHALKQTPYTLEV